MVLIGLRVSSVDEEATIVSAAFFVNTEETMEVESDFFWDSGRRIWCWSLGGIFSSMLKATVFVFSTAFGSVLAICWLLQLELLWKVADRLKCATFFVKDRKNPTRTRGRMSVDRAGAGWPSVKVVSDGLRLRNDTEASKIDPLFVSLLSWIGGWMFFDFSMRLFVSNWFWKADERIKGRSSITGLTNRWMVLANDDDWHFIWISPLP